MSSKIKSKPDLSISEYHHWKSHPITIVFMHQVKNMVFDEAMANINKARPHKKSVDQIALEIAYQAGRQSVLEKLMDSEELKNTFLPERDVNWEK